MRPARFGFAAALIVALHAPNLAAQPKPQVVTPPTGGQRSLAIGVEQSPAGPRIVARTCPTASCSLSGARPLPVQPPDFTLQPTFQLRAIGSGRHIVHLQSGHGASKWQALVAAPLGKGDPMVIWSGIAPDSVPMGSDLVNAIQVSSTNQEGTVRILVGQQSPSLKLCGRPTLLSPRVVYANDLSLRHVKMQRLGGAERKSAEQITAVKVDAIHANPAPLGQLLVATGASSAYGNPSALTDGNPETVWSERRGKEGRGEFVVMRAPSDVPIVSLSFRVRPPSTTVTDGAAPKSFFVAADGRLIRVTLPEDAWKTPDASYVLRFATPLTTSCLSVVLDEAYIPPGVKNARVSLSEVVAYSEFDGAESHESLVDALDGEKKRADAAAAVLLRGGEKAFTAVSDKFFSLNEAGRRRAMQVLDAAPCSLSSPVFASMLANKEEREKKHAQDRVRRCGRRSANALAGVLKHGAGCVPSHQIESQCSLTRSQQKRYQVDPGRLAAANELAFVAPERVVPLIAPWLGKNNRPTRRVLRRYLSRASKRAAGREALSAQLQDESLPTAATVDLLRATKDHFDAMRGPAGAAFARLATSRDLRTRYLLLEPAAKLAKAGDGRGLSFLTTRISSDPEPMVRTQAVVVASEIPAAVPWMLRALEDKNVRVRQAAAKSLAGRAEATKFLVRRLMLDDWPMVRAAAARSLATAGPSELANEQLAEHLSDPSPKVRQWSATALGARQAKTHARALRSVADAAKEKVSVRMAAVRALGQMCDGEAVGMLTIFAQRSADPYSPEAASGLGAAALSALGQIHPTDLKDRLANLLSNESVPPQIRAAAASALATPQACRHSPHDCVITTLPRRGLLERFCLRC